MNTVNRINAVIRTRKYIKAFEKFRKGLKPGDTLTVQRRAFFYSFSLPTAEEAQKLCNKFRLPSLFPPHFIIKEFPSVIPIPHSTADGRYQIGVEDDLCMPVRIDMTQSLPKIKEDIGKLYERYNIEQNKQDTESGPDNYSIWDIYDMVEKDNLSLYKVARKCGMECKPSDDLKANRLYQRVKRAYNKAQKMIDEAKKFID